MLLEQNEHINNCAFQNCAIQQFSPKTKGCKLISLFIIELKKLGQPRSLFVYFGLFKQTIQFLQQMNVKNVMSIQYPAPGFEPTTLERESTPITTRPGLPPIHH